MADDQKEQSQDTSANEDQTQNENVNADKSVGAGTDVPTIEQLQEQVRQAQAERDAARMQAWQATQGNGRTSEEEEEEAEPVNPLEGMSEERLSQMTNRELIETAVNAFSKKMEAEILPKIRSEIGSLGKTVAEKNAQADVASTAAKHKDFWNFRMDMIQLSQQPRYAGLAAEDLYLLAKSRKGDAAPAARPTGAPAKKAEDASKERDARAASEKPGSTGRASTKDAKEMSPEEAGEDAYDKVFGSKK
jgi:hypothetical protein